jgi:hypothetical protein
MGLFSFCKPIAHSNPDGRFGAKVEAWFVAKDGWCKWIESALESIADTVVLSICLLTALLQILTLLLVARVETEALFIT